MRTKTRIRSNNKEIFLSIGLCVIFLIILGATFLFIKINSIDKQADALASEKEREEEILLVNPFKEISAEIEAEAVIVKNIESGEILFSKNENKILPLASLTKLMTTLSVYELLEPQTLVTLQMQDIETEGNSFVYAGETFSLKKLIDLTLVSSSNDGASALASAGNAFLMAQNAQNSSYSKENFINYMNILAGKIGMENASFLNETGLDTNQFKPGAVGSAKDISRLVEYIIKNYPELLEATRHNTFNIRSEQELQHEIYNTNYIVDSLPNIIGSKTGYTDIAGGNLVVIIDPVLNAPISITVLGSSKEGRFTDVKRLVEATLVYFSQEFTLK